MTQSKNRSGFSMVELVFVIVVLGIVASLGAEMIANVYKNYIVQRAHHRASLKTQLALNQIANRLRYAIPGTTIRRVGKTGTPELLSDPLGSSGEDYTVLQWVGMDGDSFEAISGTTTSNSALRRPGWSGFIDLNASSNTVLSTPGSDFTLTNTIQGNLGGDGNFAIYFPNDPIAHTGTGSGETIALDSPVNLIRERYKLGWSSYAIVVEDDNGDGKDDLVLYYNFSPVSPAAIGQTKSLLLSNISNFKFRGDGQTIRIKICVKEQIGDSSESHIPSCKEKAVF